jgi:hypothetical protein
VALAHPLLLPFRTTVAPSAVHAGQRQWSSVRGAAAVEQRARQSSLSGGASLAVVPHFGILRQDRHSRVSFVGDLRRLPLVRDSSLFFLSIFVLLICCMMYPIPFPNVVSICSIGKIF